MGTAPAMDVPELTPSGAIGSPCSATNPCSVGYCVRGICCSTPCTQTCFACTAGEKESGTGDGTCGPAKAGSKPAGPCYQHGGQVDTECKYSPSTELCNGYGVCAKPVGTTQCKTECDGDGLQTYTCGPDGKCHAKFGDCGTYTCGSNQCFTNCDFDDDSKCAPGNWCRDGVCIPPQENGTGCSKNENCKSGFCVGLTPQDGKKVCCSSACAGPCETCLAAYKSSGITGDCGEVKPNQDPRGLCDADPPCGTNGSCDGNGACALFPDYQSCGQNPICEPASTLGGTSQITGKLCDGAGLCSTSITTQSCTGYALCLPNGECPTSCSSSSECASGYSCYDADGDPSDEECAKKLSAGNCTAHDQCESGHCYDNHCCNIECDADCQNCSTGTCETTPLGPPKGVKASGEPKACDVATSGDPCVAFQCNGTTTGCDGLVGGEVACRAASCADGVKTLASGCDGAGHCAEPLLVPCDGFACDGLECKASCASNDDCSSGAVCDPNTGKCAKGSSCLDEVTVKDLNGTLTDCSPFRCVGGACLEACSSNEQCADGFLCERAIGDCMVLAADDEPESPSCWCGAPRTPRSRTTAWIAALAFAIGLARRRAHRR